MNHPQTFEVRWFDGKVPVPRRALLTLEPEAIVVSAAERSRRFPRVSVTLSCSPLGAARCLDLPDGSELELEAEAARALDLAGFSRAPGELPWVTWLEQRAWVALCCVVLLLGLIVVGHTWLIPRGADALTEHVIARYEDELGRAARRSLRLDGLGGSRIPAEERAPIEEAFHGFARGFPRASRYRLKFVPFTAPNAFAFPDGTVVVTDALMERCSRLGVVAVLAHELGHVEERHAVRQTLRDVAFASWLSVLTADLGSVSLVAARFPRMLAETRYSREFEAEADEFGFRLLLAHGISPKHFAECLERITRPASEPSGWDFLSTHPSTASRIERAERAQ